MKADFTPLLVGLIIYLASLVSIRFAISVAIVEILTGAIAGNLGIVPEEWMTYLAGFGGIILTFLAGAEIDTRLMRNKFKESFLIGIFSFLLPFIGVFLYTYFMLHWTYGASLIAGAALSTTSLAVVYSVLVETGLCASELGKTIMAATFVTDMGTALALSIMFLKPTLYTFLFIAVSLVVIVFVDRFSLLFLRGTYFSNKVIEPEVKLIFLVLLIFIFFANIGEGHAVLPAFIMGLVMSKHFKEQRKTKLLRNKLRTVAYTMITPFFFIVGGMRISIPLIASAFGLFIVLFFIKVALKFLGVYFLAKKYLPQGSMYTTLLMSTGLTFGTIASLFGLNSGIITQVQYSVLVGVVVASAVIPTFIAQRWFMPVSDEDMLNGENGNGKGETCLAG
ncbi:MAG: cation:proton antiporter [Candidatus Eremiobacteraeota bacterium]|nr:cation:proton antiporter [Candidatus Eremiobacteraeota bacterium]